MSARSMRHRRLALAPLFTLGAQQPLPIADGQIIPLWSGAAPGALGTDTTDIPAITVFLPRTMTANTPAVIVAPGGSYIRLASNHEGRQVANYLNSLGVAAFVLRYRLGPRYHHPIELGDAQRAIRLLRSHAADWHLDPARIGIMGFSAGGHLAMSASTHFDAGERHCARSGRPRVESAGHQHSWIPGHLDDRGMDARGFAYGAARRESRSGARSITLGREVGHESDAADLHLPDERRHDRAGRECRLLLPRAAAGRAFPPRCTCSSTGRMASAWRTQTRRCRNGRSCSPTGFVVALSFRSLPTHHTSRLEP